MTAEGSGVGGQAEAGAKPDDSGPGVRAGIYLLTVPGDPPAEERIEIMRAEAKARGWTITGEFTDTAKNLIKDRRPGLDRLLAMVMSGEVNVVLAWSVARSARSISHMVGVLEALDQAGVRLVLIDDGIDTGSITDIGEVMTAVARLEADRRRDRVKQGQRRAARAGRRPGRPRLGLDPNAVQGRLAAGEAVSAVARELGLSRRTLRRALESLR